MKIHVRRAVYAKVSERLQASGTPFDDDPRFLAAVDDWINGIIDIGELRARYLYIQRKKKPSPSDRLEAWATVRYRRHRQYHEARKVCGLEP
jgi:hypothetical protein